MNYECVPTICPFCGCGCGILLEVLDGRIIGALPDKTHPVSEGKLCIKGWNSHVFVSDSRRLRKPLIRKRGKLVESSWEDALSLVVRKFAEQKKKDPDSIGVLSSAKCTNEENYIIQKFARAVLGTNNIDHCARLCHASTVAGLLHAFGSGSMTNSIPELQDSDCILITGSNTVEQHPLIARRIVRAKEKGAKIIVVDPRRVMIADIADIFLQPRPGTDVAWLNGFMYVVLEEGLADKEFISSRTEGFDELERVVSKYDPASVESITGISKDLLVEAARTYASADRGSIIYSMGITQHTTGTDNVKAVANLAMLTGNVGRESTGVNPLRGQNNVQGACDVGALPDFLPGYQRISDEGSVKKFEKAWNCSIPKQAGLTVVEFFEAAYKGKIRMMYIVGENPLISDPDIRHVRESLENLDFLVVQDIFLSETANLADVVLPAATFAEKDGTFTATDRRIQRVRKAIDSIGESRPDWEIVCDIAKRMGDRGFEYHSPGEIMEEIASLTPIYGGVTYERLEEGNLLWPCPTRDHPGTQYLHKDTFSRGKGRFSPVEFKEPAELPDDDFPYLLTTGRIIFHFHTGTMTRKTPKLDSEVKTGFIEVNPDDAKHLSVNDGETVVVRSRRGEIRIPAYVTETVPLGVVFIPFHFSECAANVLTNAALDPDSKIPEFKVCAVSIEKAST